MHAALKVHLYPRESTDSRGRAFGGVRFSLTIGDMRACYLIHVRISLRVSFFAGQSVTDEQLSVILTACARVKILHIIRTPLS